MWRNVDKEYTHHYSPDGPWGRHCCSWDWATADKRSIPWALILGRLIETWTRFPKMQKDCNQLDSRILRQHMMQSIGFSYSSHIKLQIVLLLRWTAEAVAKSLRRLSWSPNVFSIQNSTTAVRLFSLFKFGFRYGLMSQSNQPELYLFIFV